MKTIRIVFLILTMLSLGFVSAVSAQAEQITLRMSRDWGYGGFNGDIEGLFSMRVTGPGDLSRVDYYIDETKIGEVAKAPFNLQFNTDNYPLGIHRLFAVGISTNGQEYRSNVLSANFVPKQSSTKVMLPVFGVVLLVFLLSTLVPILTGRRKSTHVPLGTERKYGAGGGGICPKCHRPFALPLFSMHFGFSNLTPCPFCGKWSFVRMETIAKLREAEKSELEDGKSENLSESSDEEKLRKDVDDSKYQGL